MRIRRVAAMVAVGVMVTAGLTAAAPSAAAEGPVDPAAVPADPAPGEVLVDPDANPDAAAPAEASPQALACNGMALLGSGTKASPEYWRPIHSFSDGSIWPTCWMGSGHHSWAVVALQMGLRDCYGQGIPLDGIYGSRTVGAVKNVQRLHGWSVDGVYGTQTGRMAFPSSPKGRFFPHC